MLTRERQDKIVQIVNEQGAVSVADLVTSLAVSEATIRRDLNTLHKAGRIEKVFGGATSVTGDISSHEYNISEKSQKNMAEKEQIATYAASTITDEDFVFLDSGTTTYQMIPHITARQAIFVTNGIMHAKRLMESGFQTYVVGGRLRPQTEAIVGPEAVESIRKYHFTKAFMGTNGITVKSGYTTPDVDEAMLKRAAIQSAYFSYILADASKFGLVSTVEFASFESCCVITNHVPKTFRSYTESTIVKELDGKEPNT